MRNVLLLEHLSLDGFLAGPTGEMDWIHVDEDLFAANTPIFQTADAAIFGRTTYAMMAAYWPTAADNPDAGPHDIAHSRWINNSTVLVFSNTLTDAPWGEHRSATIVATTGLPGTVHQLKQQSGGDMVLIGSASLARAFVADGLVDDYYLFLNPVILGAGMPLFPANKAPRNLDLVDTTRYGCGVVGLHYTAQR